MFDQVAAGYDRTNSLLSFGNDLLWRMATVRAVAPKAGEAVLDLAAGTGTSSAALARSGATVTAADFSPGMLDVGRRKHPSIEFVEADAMALPFADDRFDAVTISFGLRNVAHPQVALAEMCRVVKPGGRIVVCEFSTPPRAVFRAGYAAYSRFVMPRVVKLASSNASAYDYLNESIEAWPDQQTVSKWLRGAGFTRVAYRNLTFGVVALHRGRKPSTRRSRRASRGTTSTTPVVTTTPTVEPAASAPDRDTGPDV